MNGSVLRKISSAAVTNHRYTPLIMKVFSVILLILLLTPTALLAGENTRSIHIFVALCDNVNQGIVSVSAALGNGKEPDQNLYWGALYGLKTYFRKSKEWKLLDTVKNPAEHILERLIFKKSATDVYMVADAYDGEHIQAAITALLESSSNQLLNSIIVEGTRVGVYGNADMLAYLGHNGLMDKPLPNLRLRSATQKKDVIVLACKSRSYFEELILFTGARPLLLTTGFMAPEAYTLKAALDGWVLGETSENIRLRAAKAYQKYQKISFNEADRLFYSSDH